MILCIAWPVLHEPLLMTARVMRTVMHAQARAGQQRQLQLL